MKRENYDIIFPAALVYCAAVIGVSLVWQGPASVARGLWAIVTSPCALTTDFFALGGPGAALTNACLVVLVSAFVLKYAVGTFNGSSLMVLGLMNGFSLFGQNIANIWPMLLGAWLYSRWKKEPFGKFAVMGLLSSSLSPVVSFFATRGTGWALPTALLVGICIGFVMPPLAAYVGKFHNGMNLYNAGFAAGLLAMVIMPIVYGLGLDPAVATQWSKDYTGGAALFLGVLCLVLLIWGLFFGGEPAMMALADFNGLWRDSGRAGCDFLKSYGPPAVLINTALVGLMGGGYILLIGGDLCGPTLGAILVMMGFAGCGKHPRNIAPIMLGVWLGTLLPNLSATAGGSQIAALFGTTLAPVAGCFGAPAGVLAGFLHSCVVLRTGGPVGGVNLYNNGFSGGLIATVLYPILTAVLGGRLKDRDVKDRYQ